MQRQASLNGYLHFEAAARCGSLSRAAEELSVSPSAVSQQIKMLEYSMGVMLFRRTGRALVLSAEGEQLFQTASAALGMLRAARGDLGQSREAQRLSLRVPPSLGRIWLSARLHGFIEGTPEQKLRVITGEAKTCEQDGATLEIRYGVGEWADLMVRPLMRDTVLPLAAPDLLRAHTGEEPLETAPLIDSAWNMLQWDGWFAQIGLGRLRTERRLSLDNSAMALEMAAAGAGVALESLALAAPLIHSGRLVPFSPDKPALSFTAYWLVCHQSQTASKPIRAFGDWIHEQAVGQESVDRGILARHGIDTLSWDPREVRAHGPAG